MCREGSTIIRHFDPDDCTTTAEHGLMGGRVEKVRTTLDDRLVGDGPPFESRTVCEGDTFGRAGSELVPR